MRSANTVSMRNLNWKLTLLVNFYRFVAGSIVWFFIALIISVGDPSISSPWSILLLPLYYPVIILVGGGCQWLAQQGVPVVGWFALFLALIPISGDPLVYFLKQKRPDLVPVEPFRFFNRYIMLYVYNTDSAEEDVSEVPLNRLN